MQSRISGLFPFIVLAMSLPAAAETDAWARLAAEDLAAARKLIAENHPAAAAGHGDADFDRALRDGFASASELAGRVRSYHGYRAVLERFAADFGDRHIASEAVLTGPQHWPGFLVSLGADWRVSVSAANHAPPVQSRLLSCDGVAPDELAQARLEPLASNWDIAAQRKRISSRLFVDAGDPFVAPPARCLFELSSGERREHVLEWTPISAADLAKYMTIAVARPSNEVSLSQLEEGWWIRLGALVDAARPIADEVERRADELRSSRFVVVDVRGNGGGASIYAERIAAMLYGEASVQEALARAAVGPDATSWRASADNLATLDEYVERFSRELGTNDRLVVELRKLRAAMENAIGNGASLSTVEEEIPKGADARSNRKLAASMMTRQ